MLDNFQEVLLQMQNRKLLVVTVIFRKRTSTAFLPFIIYKYGDFQYKLFKGKHLKKDKETRWFYQNKIRRNILQ